jgi:protein tyrosine phosphatase
MVREYECNVIVSMSKNFHQSNGDDVYWPTEAEPVKFSQIDDHKYVIKLLQSQDNTNKCEFVIRRQFEITETKYSTQSHKMMVVHFAFDDEWPEDGVPRDRANFVRFVNQVEKVAADFTRTCVVVHGGPGGSNCSLFCALSILFDQYKTEQYVDVCRSVKKLKTQRPHMIESFEQYEFLYLCLVDFVEIFGSYYQLQSNSDSDRISHTSFE